MLFFSSRFPPATHNRHRRASDRCSLRGRARAETMRGQSQRTSGTHQRASSSSEDGKTKGGLNGRPSAETRLGRNTTMAAGIFFFFDLVTSGRSSSGKANFRGQFYKRLHFYNLMLMYVIKAELFGHGLSVHM